jgi:hypothetical protein
MEVPPPDANKLLQSWMEWERGEVTPGRVMANLKTGGLRQLLEELAAQSAGAQAAGAQAAGAQPDSPKGTPSDAEQTEASTVSGQSEQPPGEELGGQPASWAPVV